MMPMKKSILIFIFSSIISLLFAQNQNNKILFLKGNITDKTNAVRQASGEEAFWITDKAIDFVLENKEILGYDREIDSLAVATVLSISNEYTARLSPEGRQQLIGKYIQLFNKFESSSTVQISVLSKVSLMKNTVDLSSFLDLLNKYVQTKDPVTTDATVYKTVLSTLGNLGNNVSFTILYNCLNDYRFTALNPDIEKAIIQLIPVSMDEVLQIVNSKDLTQINKILGLIKKNNEISSKFLSEIAENLLKETINIADNSSDKNQMVNIQLEALRILNDNRWTRASDSVISFYDVAKYEYTNGIMNDEQFITVIYSLPNIAPITAVNPLIRTLGEFNYSVENNHPVSDEVVLAVIENLGAIGDKSAFDSLLSVTYLSYSEIVLSAARVALAGLKW